MTSMMKSVHRHIHTQHIDIINVITHCALYFNCRIYDITRIHSVFIIVCFYYLSSREGSSSFGKDKRSAQIWLFHEASRDSRWNYFLYRNRERKRAHPSTFFHEMKERVTVTYIRIRVTLVNISPWTVRNSSSPYSLPSLGDASRNGQHGKKKIIYLWYEALRV